MANPDLDGPLLKNQTPMEPHPSDALREYCKSFEGRIDGKVKGWAACLVCGKIGRLYPEEKKNRAPDLVPHHKTAKTFFKAPGKAKMYYVDNRWYRPGPLIIMDGFANLCPMCPKCHGHLHAVCGQMYPRGGIGKLKKQVDDAAIWRASLPLKYQRRAGGALPQFVLDVLADGPFQGCVGGHQRGSIRPSEGDEEDE